MQTETQTKQKAATEALIADLAGDLKPEVERIESSIQTTQNHYGRYMSLLTGFGDTKQKLYLISLALIKAGANRQGIASALKIIEG